jgi:ATP-dependent RNA helicase RhlE
LSFDNLGIDAGLLRTLAALNFTQPTPIQTRAIPAVLRGVDVQAAAQTGTGKTAAFALPLLQRLSAEPARDNKRGRMPRALVLAPTRELAAQVAEEITNFGEGLPLRTVVIFGGVNAKRQIDSLGRGTDILVATPGRLLDLCGQGAIRLDQVSTLILDEADRMLDMGFIRDIRKVLAMLPKKRQNLMFSATYSGDVQELADRILQRPEKISVAPRNTAAQTVTQSAYACPQTQKRKLLTSLLNTNNWYQVLVFTRTKHGANRLATQLERAGIQSLAIHGNKSQNARTRALDAFKSGQVRVLVATDIAARGLDIPKIDMVVNFELPQVAEDYVHRIGRTGRAGASGSAIALVSTEERPLLSAIERVMNQKVTRLDATEILAQAPDLPEEVRATPAKPKEVPRTDTTRRPANKRRKPAWRQRRNNDRAATQNAQSG